MNNNTKNGKFVYKNQESMKKMYDFYDKCLELLQVPHKEEYIKTSYGKTHILIVGDENKTPIFTLHGGNGMSPLNLYILLPLLDKYCIIAPDVIGMPGKSDPYRNLSTNKDDFGPWVCEILDYMKIDRIPFVVSSYSSAMMLSLAKVAPERIEKAALIVPSGFTHGQIIPIIRKTIIPFSKYYFTQTETALDNIMNVMTNDNAKLWREFFDLMMSSYKMEMRPPKEYKKEELEKFDSPVIIFASNEDIFFPADKVFLKAEKILKIKPKTCLISGKHLPSASTMSFVCNEIIEFFNIRNSNI